MYYRETPCTVSLQHVTGMKDFKNLPELLKCYRTLIIFFEK